MAMLAGFLSANAVMKDAVGELMRYPIILCLTMILFICIKPAWSLGLADIPYGVQLECLDDHASDLAAGKGLAIANSNRISCHSNWRSWYKGNVSYITNDCPGCTDQFMAKLVNLTSACRDSDEDFIARVKEREGMVLQKSAAHDICAQRRQLDSQVNSRKKNEVIPPPPPTKRANGYSI